MNFLFNTDTETVMLYREDFVSMDEANDFMSSNCNWLIADAAYDDQFYYYELDTRTDDGYKAKLENIFD